MGRATCVRQTQRGWTGEGVGSLYIKDGREFKSWARSRSRPAGAFTLEIDIAGGLDFQAEDHVPSVGQAQCLFCA
jgi:hypothetical protein